MAQSALPKPGDFVGGKYRIERTLGQGGMGVVFEASHRVTDKRFAIKWLLTEPTRSDDSVTRFIREAQVAGRCEHRNIVAVYDIDREAGTLFMVMELLKGESLAERLLQQRRMHFSDACKLLVPCIEAVGEAHTAGIIHRDLKPANLFICHARGREPELAKVLDFGVSRFAIMPDTLASGHTKSGAVVGTPFYMAPEQMRGQPIDGRVDVYSMGITLYEVLSGVRPYTAGSYGDLLLKVAEQKAVPLVQLVPDLPPRLIEIVNRAMSYERDARFASMEELARALEPFVPTSEQLAQTPRGWQHGSQSGDTPWTVEPSDSDPFHRRSRRQRMWVVLGLGSLLVGLTSFGLMLRYRRVEGHAPVLAPLPETTVAPSADPPTSPPSAAGPETTPDPASASKPAGEIVEPVAPVAPAPLPGKKQRNRGRRAQAPDENAVEAPGRVHHERERPVPAEATHAPTSAEPTRAKSRAPAKLERSDF